MRSYGLGPFCDSCSILTVMDRKSSMSAFVPPTPGAKFHFTPKPPARTRYVKDGQSLPALRLWDRVPVTPVAPRRKTHKVWKRFIQASRHESVRHGSISTGINVLDTGITLRGTKRLKTNHDDGDFHIGRSFLETRWETEDIRLNKSRCS